MAFGRRLAPLQPGQQIGIGFLQQGLEGFAFLVRQPGQAGFGKARKPQVDLQQSAPAAPAQAAMAVFAGDIYILTTCGCMLQVLLSPR